MSDPKFPVRVWCDLATTHGTTDVQWASSTPGGIDDCEYLRADAVRAMLLDLITDYGEPADDAADLADAMVLKLENVT